VVAAVTAVAVAVVVVTAVAGTNPVTKAVTVTTTKPVTVSATATAPPPLQGGASVAGLLIVPACSAASRPLRAGCAGAREDARSLDPACARLWRLVRPALVRVEKEQSIWHSSSLS
jgi:hypothetical protein